MSSAEGQVLMVDQAYTFFKQGELEKSRQAIDLASGHEISKLDARTWYLRSFIYKELAEAKADQSSALRNISLQSALQCIAIDSSGRFSEDCRSVINYIYTAYLNEAIALLNHQDYPAVLTSLQPIIESNIPLTHDHRPEALFYYGYATLQLGEENKARQFFYQAWHSGYQDPLIYEIESVYRMQQTQWDSAQWFLTQGRIKFPDDTNLQIAELNFLMKREDYPSAETAVERYLTKNPDNTEGLLLAGTVYEKLQTRTEEGNHYFGKQIEVYEHILRLDPHHVQANYNLGIAYYNRAVKLINGAAQNYDLDILAFNQLLEECSSLFLKALPYIKKVSSLDNSHVNALKALEGIYYNINDYEQYHLVKAKLEKL